MNAPPSDSQEATPSLPSAPQELMSDVDLARQARHAKRCLFEARVVGILIVACMLVTSTIMTVRGYLPAEKRPVEPELMFGIPDWVVWGLFVPWLGMILVTWCFALFVLKDDEPLDSAT